MVVGNLLIRKRCHCQFDPGWIETMMSSLASDYALRLYCKGLVFWGNRKSCMLSVEGFFNKQNVSHRLLGL